MAVIDQAEDVDRSVGVGRSPAAAGALLALALVLWVASLPTISLSHVNGLGFAGAFTPLTWAALLAICAGAVVCVYRVPAASRWFWRLAIASLLLLIAVIHGTPMLLESGPRFFEAYNHVGFIEYIWRTGQHSVQVQNRLTWFGAFGLGATLSGTAGPPALLGAIRLTPWLFAMAILLPIHSILSAFITPARERAAALLLFVVGNWIAQDYFSPQALDYFITMTIVAIVLHAAKGGGATVLRVADWWEERRSPASVVIVITVMMVAVVLSHQISPLMLLALSLVLVVTGSTTLRAFPVATGAAVLAWLSVGGVYFWQGNIGRLLGVRKQGGQSSGVGGIVAQNLTNRLHHAGLEQLVAYSRVGLSLALLALAALSLWRGRDQRSMRVLGLLMGIPFVFLLTTGYGGEALLRAFFFALPFTAALVAQLVLRIPPRPVLLVLLSVALFAMSTMTEVARYGNEEFEQISARQLAVMEGVYRTMPPHARILLFGTALPANFKDLGKDTSRFMSFFTFPQGPAGWDATRQMFVQSEQFRPQIAIWTPEAVKHNIHSHGFKEGWDKPVLAFLENELHGRLVVDRPGIKVMSFDPSWHPPASAFSGRGS